VKRRRRGGRPVTRNPDFDAFAGELWLKYAGRRDRLQTIAKELDRQPEFLPPINFIEGKKARKALGHYNSTHSRSPGPPIKTWIQLARYRGSEPFRDSMRRTLSRAGSKFRKRIADSKKPSDVNH
jgi:hypothetical protein